MSLVLCVLTGPSGAQILPPNSVVEWSRGAGTDDWATGGNWINQSNNSGLPPAGSDVLFGNLPSGTGPLAVLQDLIDLALKSLWFETGRDYTLGGSGSFVLGGGLEDGGRLVTVSDKGVGAWQSETNIDLDFSLGLAAGYTAEIANYSAAGLRLGGAIDFGQNHLRIRGGSAVHLAGVLSGAGNLSVATDAGHVVLSANNSSWTGKLEVKHGFLVVTSDGALGSVSGGAVTIDGAGSGATLAFRPNGLTGVGVNYTSAKPIIVSGTGYERPWGSADPSDPNSALNLRPVGAIYNDGGTNAFAGDITLAGDTWVGARAGELKLSGAISDGGAGYSFTKVGRGLIELSNGTNSWSGATTLREGVLRTSATDALPNSSALVFDGGTLELGAGDFMRDFGSAAGEVVWLGDGGFSAYGAARTVTLDSDSALTWGAGGFVPTGNALLLGSAYADSSVELTNAVNLGSELREVRVTRGTTASSYGELSGKLSGTGGLIKTGNGTLWLSNTGNDYSGATRIHGGVLRGEVPSASNIQLGGGVLGLEGDFTHSIGTGAGEVRWVVNPGDLVTPTSRSGGFAAYGANRTVRLGNSTSTEFIYGDAGFVNAGGYLIFGAPDSDATVIFDNPIRFRSGGAGNNIRVIAGLDISRSVVVFKQSFRTTNNNTIRDLHFWGDGRVDIIAANPDTAAGFRSNFVGARGTDLRLSSKGSLLGIRHNSNLNSYPIEAWWGGSITFDNYGTWESITGGEYVAQRIRAATSIALYAGTFRYWGRASGNSASEASQLRLHEGANEMDILHNATGNDYTGFTFNSLRHIEGELDNDGNGKDGNYYATINFTSNSDFGTSVMPAGTTIVRFKNKPDHIGGIMPYATVKGEHWARTKQVGMGSSAWHYLTAYDSYTTGGVGAWTVETVDASPADDVTLGSTNKTINSLRLTDGRTVDLNGHTLTLKSGGLLAVGSVDTKISNGTLTTDTVGSGATSRTNTLFAHVYNTAGVGLEISAKLDLKGRSKYAALVKTGTGTLLLSGNTSNTITGTTYVHQGTLALGKTGGATAIGGTIIVGDKAGRDTLRLDRGEQIANNATVTLRGGHPDPEHRLGAEGILQFNGAGGRGLRETFGTLTVEGHGVIDFKGGTVGRANFLILEDLKIDSFTNYYTASQLTIRNWFEGEDFLLVRRTSVNLIASLPNIVFEGYGPAILRDWNKDYYQVTPNPEPSTYGAILGAVGVGLLVWRRRKGRGRQHSNRLSD